MMKNSIPSLSLVIVITAVMEVDLCQKDAFEPVHCLLEMLIENQELLRL